MGDFFNILRFPPRIRRTLASVVQLAAQTVEKLKGIQIQDPMGTVPHSLDTGAVFLKPLVTWSERGTPEGRQRVDAINMFRVFDLLSKVFFPSRRWGHTTVSFWFLELVKHSTTYEVGGSRGWVQPRLVSGVVE
mgnify:CR=1 FL=1